MKINHLSPDDISEIKGLQVRCTKSQDQDYKRGWAKLAKAQKLNRLMNYHKKITKDYDLNSEQQIQLKTLFYDGISSDILDKNLVNYDSNAGSIVKIDGLKSDSKQFFYIEKSVNLEHNNKIQTIKQFKPVSIAELSVAETNEKVKPLIKIKPKIKMIGNN